MTEDTSKTPSSLARQIARALLVVVFLAIWMAAGWLLKLDPNGYLLLGVPLTALFQMGAARRPLRSLWVRSAPPLRIDAKWLLVSAGLASLPIYFLYQNRAAGWIAIAWCMCAVAGAPVAAYALQNHDDNVARGAKPARLMVFLLCGLMILGAVVREGVGILSVSAFVEAVKWSLLYFSVGFIIEEVTFRGALDSFLFRPGDRYGLISAAALGALWGIWHVPTLPAQEMNFITALRLALGHAVVGLVLSTSWRTGGNLWTPAAAHAVLDGVRNALHLA